MVKVGIIGATGYAGNELVRLLMGHKDVEIMWYGSRSYIDKKYAEVYQNMFEIVEDTCLDDNMEELASKVDVIFTATPQGFLAGVLTEEILSRVKIIDLSADFRIKDVKTYEKWYKIRHTPEIEEQLGYAAGKEIMVNFTPHLVPMNRGILATEYAALNKKADGTLPTYGEVKAIYDKYYKNEKFVRVLEKDICPETKWVEGSNYVDVNFKIDERTGRIVMMGALDNLVKGAAGQAVQNMNLLFGFDEAEGLNLVPMFP